MSKTEILDQLLQENKGYLKTSDAAKIGISRTYIGEYVRIRGLERVAQGLYMSPDAWEDGLYVIQTRYPKTVFSHETALYLLNLAEREPTRYAVTLEAGTGSTRLTKLGLKIYKVKIDLFETGIVETQSPTGHTLRTYNAERTICDLLRSKSTIEIQDIQAAVRGYVRIKEKNIPQLMRYAKIFSVEKPLRQYLEVLL
jgi:predicted transcriptional regulator of viral defense system